MSFRHGAKDMSSAHDMATAASGSGDHQAEVRLQAGTMLQKKAEYNPSVWKGEAGTKHVPFPASTFSSAPWLLGDAHYDSVPVSITL